ncbi:MAG: hypothetical protein M0T84_07205 [Betaproteobacteria bacterium]|nr:hypothetical protein [Betaproteobacteria bacterium]
MVQIRLLAICGLFLSSAVAWADPQAAIVADHAANVQATQAAATAWAQAQAYTSAQAQSQNVANEDIANAQDQYGIYEQDLDQANAWNVKQASDRKTAQSATDPSVAQQYQTAAAHDAQEAANRTNKANQDYSAYQAWMDAANGAQAIADQQGTLASEQAAIARQSEAEEQNSLDQEMNDAQDVTAETGAGTQAAGKAGATSSFSSIQSSTGVSQGQVSGAVSQDTSYLAAGMAEQAALNGLAKDEAQSNIDAVHAAQTAASCGNYACAAYWGAVNYVKQTEADADFAAGTGAAPVLGMVMDQAASKAAQQDVNQVGQAIQTQTGVTQGVPAGVNVMTAPITASTDSSYTHAADPYNSQQEADNQANINAGVSEVQTRQGGLTATTVANAARSIATQDNAAAARAPDFEAKWAWLDAAGNAQAIVDREAPRAQRETQVQQQDAATENSAYAQAMSTAQPATQALDSGAAQSGISSYDAAVRQIQDQTGVAQQVAQ